MLSSDPIPQELGTVMKVGNGPKFCPAVPEHIGEKEDKFEAEQQQLMDQ